MTDIELAWAGGIFEGEGSVRINSPTQRNLGALLVDMVNTDKALVEFFNERWPGYFRSVSPAGNRRIFWRWRIAAHDAAEFLRAVQPFLRGEKRARVALGLEYQLQKVQSKANRTPEYRARQISYFDRMKALNSRGSPVGSQMRLLADAKQHRKVR